MNQKRLIDIAKRHYAAQKPRQIEIPEWGAVGYVRPITLADQTKLISIQQKFKDNDFEMFARVVQVRLTDANGEPFFSEEDLPDLLSSVDGDVLMRLGNEIQESPGVDEVKNS